MVAVDTVVSAGPVAGRGSALRHSWCWIIVLPSRRLTTIPRQTGSRSPCSTRLPATTAPPA